MVIELFHTVFLSSRACNIGLVKIEFSSISVAVFQSNIPVFYRRSNAAFII